MRPDSMNWITYILLDPEYHILLLNMKSYIILIFSSKCIFHSFICFYNCGVFSQVPEVQGDEPDKHGAYNPET